MNPELRFKFLSCPENHICGFSIKMQYYFNKMSPIKFKYPQNKEFPWALEFWDNNFEKA